LPPAINCRLCLVSPDRIEHPTIFASEMRAALDGGDVAAFLLRMPGADDAAITRAADTLRPICQQRDVAFFLEGRPDLALKLDCDGVQVGSDGPTCAEARRVVGPERQVGVACPASRHVAMEAAETGADYVAFDAADLEMIEWWSGLFETPCVATGDIVVKNCKPVIAAGADFLAVGSGVWDHDIGPEAAVRAFNAMLSTHR
jgi:thiamine-phosphate pyrophosphorylase